MRKIRAVTIEAYHPVGTKSCITVDVMYYGRHRHKVSGPSSDKEHSLHMAKVWAFDNGFTHYRMLGEQGMHILEAPK